jgi:hypothetical protein
VRTISHDLTVEAPIGDLRPGDWSSVADHCDLCVREMQTVFDFARSRRPEMYGRITMTSDTAPDGSPRKDA